MKQKALPIPAFDQNESVIVQLAGVSYKDPTFKIHQKNSPYNSFEYILSGSGKVIRGKEYDVKEGDTFFLFEGEDHIYSSSRNDPWEKIWVSVTGPLTESLIDIYKLRGHAVVHCDTRKYIEEIHEILLSEKYTSRQMADKIGIVFHQMIQAISANAKASEAPSTDALTVKEYIDSHICEQITIEKLSELICKSTSHTIRIFKSAYGISPYKYYTKRRLERINYVLRNTDLSVKEVAFMFGFSDEHYFNTFFKAKTGNTPGYYKKHSL